MLPWLPEGGEYKHAPASTPGIRVQAVGLSVTISASLDGCKVSEKFTYGKLFLSFMPFHAKQ